ncbi:hypothetical protein H6S10_16995 [Escherichia coli]|nr:hypothetical protein H6S10_16995 [Escherichia coli]
MAVIKGWASLSVETMTAFILQENVLKKNKQKAAASANAAAGTKTELSFLSKFSQRLWQYLMK